MTARAPRSRRVIAATGPSIRLHPALHNWFFQRFEAFTEIQAKALPHTTAGANTLILAPTGTGKTLAAFLSVLSRLAEEAENGELPNAVRAVYVSPLKSLTRDIHRNLEPPLEALNAILPPAQRIRMDVRTGDTAASDRSRQQNRKPHLLLTTPESLSTMLAQTHWSKGGFDARTALVDEIHALAENKRGTLLTLALERLESQASGGPLQRIGLSATAWPIDRIAQFLCGPQRECQTAAVDTGRAHKLEIAVPQAKEWLPPAGHGPSRISPVVARLVTEAQCSLIFCTTRSAAERLGLALGLLLPEHEERIVVHHGSIDRDARLKIEAGLADGSLKAVVCSSSLELGVDFAAVDQVLLIGAPYGISRAIQRLGRSGRRIDGVAAGALVPLSLPNVLQCIAVREGARTGRLDPIHIPHAPLDVLAQTLLAMSIERPWRMDDAFELVRRTGPYSDLDRTSFDSVLHYLAGGGRVLSGYGTYGKIVLDAEARTFRVASRKTAREFYMNAGIISDDMQVRVMQRSRRLGHVEEGFLASLQPGEAFTIGGKTVKLRHLHENTALVEPASGEKVKTPRWLGNKMSLSIQLAREELELRRALREAWDSRGAPACAEILRERWNVGRAIAHRVAQFLDRQSQAAPIPIDSPVQIERVLTGRSMTLCVHVVAGRAVNRSLAWVAGHRLAPGSSVSANFDDHAFLLTVDSRICCNESDLRRIFDPLNWLDDLRTALASTETLGRSFRNVAEIGQLLHRRTLRGPVARRTSAGNGALLYKTFLQHEPDHPLVRECIRVVLEDECDAARAHEEATRIFETPFEIYDVPRPSPFALQLFAAFNREVLLAQDPDRALDDFVNRIYDEWGTTE